jgi:uncharacterized protein
MPLWVQIVLAVVVVYLVISALLYYLQDFFLFKPEKLAEDFKFSYENQVVEEYNISIEMELP